MEEKELEADENKFAQQSPSIKLTRNTKGYFFEIKILSCNVSELDRIRKELVDKIAGWMREEA